jgi:hypothetical protein
MSWQHTTYAPVFLGIPEPIFVMLAMAAVLAATTRWAAPVLQRLVRQKFRLSICQKGV